MEASAECSTILLTRCQRERREMIFFFSLKFNFSFCIIKVFLFLLAIHTSQARRQSTQVS